MTSDTQISGLFAHGPFHRLCQGIVTLLMVLHVALFPPIYPKVASTSPGANPNYLA